MKTLIQKALVVYKKWEYPNSPFRFEHQKTLQTVQKILKKYQVYSQQVSRRNLKNVQNFDLIITVGGDGTFLHASHFAPPHHLLLGVNSAPSVSVGAYCFANRQNFEKVLLKILEKKAPILSLHRLQVKIQNQKIPILALNDILFTNPIPAGTSRYRLKVGSICEEQKSSGVWISTASGSSAAIRSAGGKLLPRTSSKFQFVVRELFSHREEKFKLEKKVLNPSQKLTLVSTMQKAAIFIDGAHVSYKIKREEKIEIESARNLLRVVL